MEQYYFGKIISDHRKLQGLTQEGLAQKLEVTNQAVSKWESDQCCPDIMLLPALADAFGISVDELFGRPAPEPIAEYKEAEKNEPDGQSWEDDDTLRAVCYVGRRQVAVQELRENCFPIARRVTLEFTGSVENIISSFDVECGNVDGNVSAGGDVDCGSVEGSVSAGRDVDCGSVEGSVIAGSNVDCGNVEGDVTAKGDIDCGDVGGCVRRGGEL